MEVEIQSHVAGQL